MGENKVKWLREELLLSKAELSRKTGSTLTTIDRIERGEDCRMDTKRKIILALGCQMGGQGQDFSRRLRRAARKRAREGAGCVTLSRFTEG